MKRSRLLGAISVALVVSLFGGFVGTAHADPADDVAIMIDNLPAAAEDLSTGLQDAIFTYVETESAVALSEAIGDALVSAGSTLVAGTEQFGALGLGFALINGSVQQALLPYLEALDDPAGAGGVFNPDDVTTLVDNLALAVDALLHGNAAINPGLDPDGASCAVAELLRGNLTAGSGFGAIGTPAVFGCAFTGLAGFLVTLVEGTNYSPLVTPVGIALLVAAIAAGDYVQQAEDGIDLGPLAELLEPIAALVETI